MKRSGDDLRGRVLLLALAVSAGLGTLLVETQAFAIPRYAARAGTECIQCHVNPAGGGVRSAYGRTFARTWLPFRPSATSTGPAGGLRGTLGGELTDWLALGADLRAAYMWIRPDDGPTPGAPPQIISSFFLMQGALYLDAAIEDHVRLMLSMSVYAGIEAWGLLRLNPEPTGFDLTVKVGRFMPAFGIREVAHDLYTRQWVGLGNADRDTGVELTAYLGPFSAALSFLNGTLGDSALDTRGTEPWEFQKALVARVAGRLRLGGLRAQLGGSFYWAGSARDPNPLFAGALPQGFETDAAAGLDEMRWGGFATASFGRFTYLGDLVFVRDVFARESVPTLLGYASYQELSFVPVQGLDIIATLEFRDRDVLLLGDWALRTGLVVELFPLAHTEVRGAVRREWNGTSPTGGTWDAVLFLHLFL